MTRENLMVVRGAGDIATGTIYRLHQAGFKVIALETEAPTVIRRSIAFAQAVIDGEAVVEGVRARCISADAELDALLREDVVTVCVDPQGALIKRLKPIAVIDGILAKKNLGTTRGMAPITIGLGPGFTAGGDVDAVIETNRGHDLGRVLYSGTAAPNTGIPGMIGGYTHERVIHAAASGQIHLHHDIGDLVDAGECIAHIDAVPVNTVLKGVLRGMISDGSVVRKGLKIADVDPRGNPEYCYRISDKARNISGGVLEAVLHLKKQMCSEQIKGRSAWQNND